MSSKRGRKRNDNLPPNRARDVQRAFRARRAAHLQALEQRVAELEEENTALRQALNLPPANRPSLGKGPTGKDKARPLESGTSRPTYPVSARSRDSSSADMDSPGSTRTNSVSPSAITSMRPSPRSAHALDSSAGWDQSLLMGDHHTESQAGSSSYPLAPVSASVPQKVVQQYSFSNPMHPNPRNNMASGMYMGSQPSHYSPDTERPMSGTYNNSGYIGRDIREEQPFSYSQTQFPDHESGMQSHSPTASTSHHSQSPHPSRETISTHSNASYSQRRSHTEPSYRPMLNQHSHLTNAAHPHISSTIRLPSPPRPPDGGPRPHAPYSGVDGRINSMP